MNIGDIRKFSFTNEEYRIIEIIDGENLSMQWDWNKITCPKCNQTIETCPICNKKIGGLKKHQFNIIKLLIPKNLEFKGHEDKLLILGFTKDEKIMLVPPEQSFKILIKSKIFNKEDNKNGQ